MKLRLTIDRFEGDAKSIAVLLADDGAQINFPKPLLPPGSKAGDILSFSIETDAGARARIADETKAVQRELHKGDSGGDITL